MKTQSLLNKPYPHLPEILRTFELGRPLSPDQINFLSRYHGKISSTGFDPVLRYYLKKHEDKNNKIISFTLPEQKLTHISLKAIKSSVQKFLSDHLSQNHIDLKMTFAQFQAFRAIGINELIFWHGNQFLTGAPFYSGGIPHLIYVQWGNLFGVVKLQVLLEETVLKGNVLIYFEDMHNRTLYECIKDYSHHLKLELSPKSTNIISNIDEQIITHRPKPFFKPYFHELS